MREKTDKLIEKSGKLTTDLTTLTVTPLLVFGMLVLIITSGVIYGSLRDEIKYSLSVLVHSAYQVCDLSFPGDFSASNGRLFKGGVDLQDHFELVDDIKSMSGSDATLFCGNTRYLTTIAKEDGSRAIGTSAAQEVAKAVLENGDEYFSEHVLVNGTQYFGYYIPLKDSSGSPVGMLFAGKTRQEIMTQIDRSLMLVCLTAIGIMGIAIFITSYYSKKIISSLRYTKEFLGEIVKGDLKAEIDPSLLKRQDEIGEMGRFAVVLQDSISDLIGKDSLTGLYNRRSGNTVLESLAKKCAKKDSIFTVAMGDIDFFKKVNDTYGHQAGDEVLKTVAACFSEHMEHLGFVFRWGGEEFLVVYEDADRKDAYGHLLQFQQKLRNTETLWNGKKIKVAMTFGVAEYGEETEVSRLIQLADHNLYQGKRDGRNRVVYTRRQKL